MAEGSGNVSFDTARRVYVGIAVAPFALAGVTWLFDMGGEAAGPPGVAAWASWILISGYGLVLWYLFRRKAVEPVTGWSRSRRAEEEFSAETLQKRLIIAWSGAQAVGFAGPVVYGLGGDLAMMVSSLAVALLCFVRSAPRREWYRTATRGADQ